MRKILFSSLSFYSRKLLLTLTAFLFVNILIFAQTPGNKTPEFVPNRVIVKFKTEAVAKGATQFKTELRKGLQVKRARRINAIDVEVWDLPAGNVKDIIEKYKNDPRIKYIEPDYIIHGSVTPNDPSFGSLWGMTKIQAPAAWDTTTGGSVVVGVIDTGVDYLHEDLASNIWTNPGEIPGNGIDDDNNGYIDDIHGYDFVNNDGDPMDDNRHGTHCAGTIAGAGNNGKGVAGVNWTAKIMALKFISASNGGNISDAIRAVLYATQMGAQLTSNSWGGSGYSQALYDAIQAAGNANILFIASAGNNNSNGASYPAAYNLDNIISVAATDINDARASFSNYSLTLVDLGAPGVGILSTTPGNSYAALDGTSMACPHVAGAAALILSKYPSISYNVLREIIINSGDPVASLAGKTVSGKRLNVFNALKQAGGYGSLAAPSITVSLSQLIFSIKPDSPVMKTLTIANATGSKYLNWSITSQGCSWLSTTTPLSGSLYSGASQVLQFTPSENMAAGIYQCTLNINSNDPGSPVIPVSVNLEVLSLPAPVARVSKTSITYMLDQGRQADSTITISNIAGIGSRNLRWSALSTNSSFWLTLSGSPGISAAGNANDLHAFANTSGLSPGTYRDTVNITTNDLANPLIRVPVELIVNSVPVWGKKLYSFNGTPTFIRSNLDGTNAVVPFAANNVTDGTIDAVNRKIYWIEAGRGLWWANLDGTDKQLLADGITSEGGIQLDVANNRLYFIYTVAFGDFRIERANLDGSNRVVVGDILDRFVELKAIDVVHGKLYWTSSFTGMWRSNLDLSNKQNLQSSPQVYSLTLDVAAGKMYWSTSLNGSFVVFRGNLDGVAEAIVLNRWAYSLQIDPAGGKIYWVEGGNTNGYRANLNGTGIQSIGRTAKTLALDLSTACPPVVTANAVANQTVCNGAAASVTLTGSPADVSFTWSNNNPSIGLAASGTSKVINFTAVNTSTEPVTATITATPVYTGGSEACSPGQPIQFTITVNPSPTAIFIPASQTICSGVAITPIVSAGGETNFTWTRDNEDLIDGMPASGTGPVNGILYNQSNEPATVTFTLTPANSECILNPATVTITVKPSPAMPVVPSQVIYCQNAPAVPLEVATTGNATALFYPDVPDGQGIPGPVVPPTDIQGSRIYYVSQVLDGCESYKAALTVIINRLPLAQITITGPTVFCTGKSVLLTASEAASYSWTTGATTRSITVTQSGTYGVTLTNEFGCSATAEPVTIDGDLPVRAPQLFVNGATTFCAGNVTNLIAEDAAAYLWSNGSTDRIIDVTQSGIYSVRVTWGDGCSQVSAPLAITVNPTPATPIINASGPTSFCRGESLVLTASESPSYQWSTGETTQSITPSYTGSFTVTATNEFGCSATSVPTTVTLNEIPATPTITNSGTTFFCTGSSVVLTASEAAAYLWSNGTTTRSITATESGNYTVTAFNESGCSATSSAMQVTVYPLPVATISASGPTTFCSGSSIFLTASPGASFAWSTGATTQSIVVAESGNYAVTITNGNGCSAISQPTTVTVSPALATPTITASGSTVLCQGTAVTLTSSSSTGNQWFVNGLPISGATDKDYIATTQGNYTVTVTLSAGCSASSAPINVIVIPAQPVPTITAGGLTTFCSGASVTLTASAGFSYSWSNGAATQSITVTEGGNYFVTVMNTSGCSATSAPVSITVNPSPVVEVLTNDATEFCAGGSAKLQAVTGRYLLVNAPGINPMPIGMAVFGADISTTPFSGNFAYIPDATSSYLGCNTYTPGSLTGKVALIDRGVCGFAAKVKNAQDAGASAVIVVNNSPGVVTMNANPDPTIIIPVIMVGSADGLVLKNLISQGPVSGTIWDPNTYLWSNGATTPVITATEGGNYTVTVTNTAGCSTLSAPLTVTVSPLQASPVITANGATTFCEGGSVTLSSNAATGNQWYLNGNPINGATAQTFVATASGEYSVTATSAGGCSASSAITAVTVNPLVVTPTVTANGGTIFCTGGSVTLTSSAATGNQWYLNGSAISGAINNAYTATAAGNYTVTVTVGGCSASSASTAVTVNQPAAISASPANQTFSPQGNATFSITATGTSLAYRWQVSTNGGVSFSNISDGGVYAGSATPTLTLTSIPVAMNGYRYQCVIIGACNTVTSSAAILSSSGACVIPVANIAVTSVNCKGSSTGAINLTVTSGSAPFTYLWTGPNGFTAATEDVSGLKAGAYSVKVTATGGCFATISTTVNEPATALVVSPVYSPIQCAGSQTTVDVRATGGAAPYTGTGFIRNQFAGSHTYAVTDANGCTVSTTIVIADGTGTGPAAQTITGVSAVTTGQTNVDYSVPCVSGQTYTWTVPAGASITSGAGTCAIKVTFGASAVSDNVKVTVNNFCGTRNAVKYVTVSAPSSCVTPVGNVAVTNVSCKGSSTGAINLTVTAGSAPFTYSWTGPGGFTATTEDIAAVKAGTYAVKVTATGGCFATISGTVNEPATALTTTATAGTITCNGGTTTVVVTASGGTAPYTGTGTFTNQSAGSKSYTVTDASGCSVTKTITISQPAAIFVNPVYSQIQCAGSQTTVDVRASGGTAPYTGTGFMRNQYPGSHTYSVTDANGCVGSATIVIADGTGTGPAAQTITGLSTVTTGQTNVDYSVPCVSGQTYTWTVPAGASVTSGAGTCAIKVTFGSSAVSGNVKVTVNNFCGTRNAVKYVTVNSAPPVSPKMALYAATEQPYFRIYPNPVTGTGTFIFSSVKRNQKFEIRITTLTGKTLYTKNGVTVAGENKFTLNMSNYVSGTYLVTLFTNNTVQIIKAVKAN